LGFRESQPQGVAPSFNSMKRREEMTFWERIYVVEMAKGVALTFGRLLKNLNLHIQHFFGLKPSVPASVNIAYPEARRPYAERFRGRHRLTLKENGEIRCTACFLCATACPARCIYIEPAEHPDSGIEKFPHRFEIDTLLCIYCGYCVEACPVDAIRMDTGLHPEVYPADPRLYIEDKEVLMKRSLALQTASREELYQAHMRRMQQWERRKVRPAAA
jgi:NADH-quinone oxidoreductase subunit I